MRDVLCFAAFIMNPESKSRFLYQGKATITMVGHEPLEYLARCDTNVTFVAGEFSLYTKPFRCGNSIYAFGSDQKSSLSQLLKFLEEEKSVTPAQIKEIDKLNDILSE